MPENNIEPWYKTEGYLNHKEQAQFLGLDPMSLSSALSRGVYTYPRIKVARRYWAKRCDIMKSLQENHRVGK